MEWHRVKSIILAILAIVNGMLLLLVWNQRSESRRYERAALDGVIRVLEEQSIQLEYSAVEGQESCRPVSAERDPDAETRMAESLLGESVRGENLGGGLYTYTSALGTLSIRPGGALTAQLADVPEWQTQDPEKHAAALMERLSIPCRLVSSSLSSGSGTVLCQQLLEGVPVFSCQVLLTYEQGRLCSLSGVLLVVSDTQEESGTLLSLPTVLMRFLDEVTDNGDVCSAIQTVEPGYLLTQSFSSAVQLRPVWYIVTNTADYYVDGITGALSRAGTA